MNDSTNKVVQVKLYDDLKMCPSHNQISLTAQIPNLSLTGLFRNFSLILSEFPTFMGFQEFQTSGDPDISEDN